MIGFDFCAVRGPWLEYANGVALRAGLAGLTMVGTSFGDAKRESPPAAAGAEAYRARALTSTVLHARLSDLPLGFWRRRTSPIYSQSTETIRLTYSYVFQNSHCQSRRNRIADHPRCREMGVQTAVVYSTADKDAAYLKLADQSICIGSPAGGKLSEYSPHHLGRGDRGRAGDSSGIWISGGEPSFRGGVPELQDRIHRAAGVGNGGGGRQGRVQKAGEKGEGADGAGQRWGGR